MNAPQMPFGDSNGTVPHRHSTGGEAQYRELLFPHCRASETQRVLSKNASPDGAADRSFRIVWILQKHGNKHPILEGLYRSLPAVDLRSAAMLHDHKQISLSLLDVTALARLLSRIWSVVNLRPQTLQRHAGDEFAVIPGTSW